MEVYIAAMLYFGAANVLAAVLISRYAINRSRTMDATARPSLIPLHIFAMGLLFYGTGYVLTFYEYYVNQPLWVDYLYTLYIFMILELMCITVSASLIIRQRVLVVVSLIITGILMLFTFQSAILLQTDPSSTLAVMLFYMVRLFRFLLLTAVSLNFVYIAFTRRRVTTTAMAFALLSQVLALPSIYIQESYVPYPLYLIPLFVVLFGPAVLMIGFVRPEQKVSTEVWGYGVAFSGAVIVVSTYAAHASPFVIVDAIIVGFGGLTFLLAIGTSAYLFGRWQEQRQLPTILLSVALFLLGLATVIGMLGSMGEIDLAVARYTEIMMAGLGLSLFAMSALYAAGYRTIGIIPLVFYVPVALVFIQQFILGKAFEVAFVEFAPLVAIIVILEILPAILFAIIWMRLRAKQLPGQARALGLAVGIISLFLISIPFTVLLQRPGVELGYGLVWISYGLIWLAVTGRLNRLEKMRRQ